MLSAERPRETSVRMADDPPGGDGKRYAVREDLTGKYQQRALSAQVDTITLHKGSFAPIGPGTVPVETVDSYTTQSRFGSFTYKRFTVPQEVHRSAKRLSLFPLSDRLKKPFSFSLQRRPGRTSPPPPEAETTRPLMSCEPPQCSHVLLGMDNYSP